MKKLLLLLTLLLTFLGCGGEKNSIGSGKNIIVAQAGNPKSLDPQMYNEIPGLFIDKQIFDTLLAVDDNKNIVPELAEKYEYLNEQELKITLKKGIKFHNGEELKASDVAFSINRMKEKPGSKVMVDDISKVEILDDYTVILKLKKPSAALLFALAHPLTSILNEKDVLSKNDEISNAPVGTGAFKFITWENRDKIELVANKEYFKGKSKINKLTFVSIPEGSSRLIALETGEVDIAVGMAAVDNQGIKGNSKLTLISEPTSSTENLTLNIKNDKLSSREVRQAINYAINKQSIIDAIFAGTGKVANTMVNPQVFGSYQDVKNYEYNPEKAKELLKSVGKDNGLKLKLWVNDNVTRTQTAQIIQSNLKEVGIDVDIEVLEWSTYLQKSANGEHEMLLGGWVSGTLDADIVLFPLFHSSSIGAAGNRAFYVNPEVDKFIEEGRTALTLDERKEAYEKAQIILSTDLPMIPLFYKNENIGISKKVKNFKYNPTTMHSLYNLDKE